MVDGHMELVEHIMAAGVQDDVHHTMPEVVGETGYLAD